MAERPDVSILMPTRNVARYVVGAIESIALQEGATVELLAVDDGSQDGTVELVRAQGRGWVRLLQNTGRGIADALNLALAEARGRYVARCDADDWYIEGRLAQQVQWLDRHRDFAAICGSYRAVDQNGRLLCTMPCGEVAEEITGLLREGQVCWHLCTYLMETEAVRRIGGFRRYFVTAEDIDFQLRLAEVGRVWYEPVPRYDLRVHDGSVTHTQAGGLREFYERTARMFAEQRRRGEPDDLEKGQPPAPPTTDDSAPRDAAEHIQGLLEGEAWRLHAAGRRWAAVRVGLSACLQRPGNLAAWKGLGALLAKRTGKQEERA